MDEIMDNSQVIEVEETPIQVANIDPVNHATLENRYADNQHSINAIEGLSQKLNDLESLKDTEASRGKGYAEYWAWSDKNATKEDRTGYFVSLVKNDDNNTYIEITNENNYNVFGVTTSKTTSAFVGNEELTAITDEETGTISGYESTRDSSYGLVCLVGTVKVRYLTSASEIDIKSGDYVKPGTGGYAVKAENNDGYYRVVNTGVDFYGNYVVINLSLSASDVDNISIKHAKTADDYTENGTIKTALDNMDEKIDTEISNTKDAIEHGVIIARIAKDFDITEGGIKDEFDRVETEFDKIKDGTTVVAKANTTNYIDVTNVAGEYVKKVNLVTTVKDEYKDLSEIDPNTLYMVEDDDTLDLMAKQLDECYYLGMISSSHDKYINYECTLDSILKPGTYVLDRQAVRNKLITGLPEDISIDKFETARLIVEYDNSYYQTLEVSYDNLDDHNEHLSTYQRVAPGQIDWTIWHRFVSAEELISGDVVVNNALNDSDGNPINTTYAKLMCDYNDANGDKMDFPIGSITTFYTTFSYYIGCSCENGRTEGSLVAFDGDTNKAYLEWSTELSDPTNYKEVSGTWRICGFCGNSYYIIQRIS